MSDKIVLPVEQILRVWAACAPQQGSYAPECRRMADEVEALRRERDDANLRTALWSRGALPLPEPWRWDGGVSGHFEANRGGYSVHVCNIYGWCWRGFGKDAWPPLYPEHARDTAGPDPLACLRAAEAWLDAKEAPDAS